MKFSVILISVFAHDFCSYVGSDLMLQKMNCDKYHIYGSSGHHESISFLNGMLAIMDFFLFENFPNIFFLVWNVTPTNTYVHIILFGKLLLLQVMTSNRALLISLIPYFGIGCFSSPSLYILGL